MKEQFHHTLSPDVLHPLMERNDHQALWRFIVQYTLLLASAGIIIIGIEKGLSIYIIGFATLIFSTMTLSMFAIVHESGHNTAFKSRRLNHQVCWLACLPIFYVPTGFRELHFAHHRFTHIPGKDPEISFGGKPAPGVTTNWFMYLGFASGLPLLFYKVNMTVAASIGGPDLIWSKFMFYVRESKRAQMIREARLAMALYILILIGGYWLPGLWYLFAAQWFGHSILSFYTMAEHNGLNYEGSIVERTRTTKTSALIRWLVWNMPYHVEHHAYPAVPWHALDKLHQELSPELQFIGDGYLHFHGRVISSLLKGQAFKDIG